MVHKKSEVKFEKDPPSGRAEIENGVWYHFDIFNFSFATRGYFLSVHFLHLWTLRQKIYVHMLLIKKFRCIPSKYP